MIFIWGKKFETIKDKIEIISREDDFSHFTSFMALDGAAAFELKTDKNQFRFFLVKVFLAILVSWNGFIFPSCVKNYAIFYSNHSTFSSEIPDYALMFIPRTLFSFINFTVIVHFLCTFIAKPHIYARCTPRYSQKNTMLVQFKKGKIECIEKHRQQPNIQHIYLSVESYRCSYTHTDTNTHQLREK